MTLFFCDSECTSVYSEFEVSSFAAQSPPPLTPPHIIGKVAAANLDFPVSTRETNDQSFEGGSVSSLASAPCPFSVKSNLPTRPPTTSFPNSPRRTHKTLRYSLMLAETAPDNASPLPNADDILACGFVLARLSVRTIMMKKWKQTYWVQYGPTSLLIFRSVIDCEDWLTNPYHTQKMRDFLVKGRFDFSGGSGKLNGLKYLVTQTKTKSQGRLDNMSQFKLERIKEFGAAIVVAVFASQIEKEVEDIRSAILCCIKNANDELNG
mmetsp:Transcript_33468/g.49232  ORF Transcript_33468/g.49232 Transcript_33468/m.49232 type:complete len:265 (+) Transcript_33468:66-860(+)